MREALNSAGSVSKKLGDLISEAENNRPVGDALINYVISTVAHVAAYKALEEELSGKTYRPMVEYYNGAGNFIYEAINNDLDLIEAIMKPAPTQQAPGRQP